jgi:hypothetical protein
MKIFFSGILCAAATALLANSLRHNESGDALQRNITAPKIVSAAVTVGTVGNEPLIAAAPDGTLYISALQHLYRSTDGGANWTTVVGPPEAEQLNLNSDSSISVDPGNRLYFTFDYPYAGTTAVCTTDDKGVSWFCNPAVVPGGTDRMWVVAPTTSAAYEVTNEGLYETAFLMTGDRGLSWVPKGIGDGLLQPQSGPLLQKPCSAKVVQPIKASGLQLYVYDPGTTGAILSDVRPTGLANPSALPGAAFSLDGVLYVSSEDFNATGGRQILVSRSADEGVTWTQLPPIPATTTGTATFSWVAAGAPGHIGVIYYYSAANGDPSTMIGANWSAMWAETFNADSASPTWTVATVENLIRTGPVCIAGCNGSNRFAGDFISAVIDSTGAAHLTWMRHDGGESPVLASIRYQKIQSGPPSIYVPPACGQLPLPVKLNSVVSRKVHGGIDTFDVDLPVTGTHGIECRNGPAPGQYSLVFTFSNPLHSVGSANVTSGTGTVSSTQMGSDAHQYIVNLTGVANAQHIFVALHNVQDEAGRFSDVISAPMSVLLGDTNANGTVSNADVASIQAQVGASVTQSNFRNDVNANGTLSNGDVAATQAQVGTQLPP